METTLTIFLSASLIMLFAISPLPTLPILIMNYTLNGLANGYIAFCIGLIGALSCHYHLGWNFKYYYSKINKRALISKIFIGRKNLEKLSEKFSNAIANLSLIEFLLLRLSGVLPFKLVNIISGINRRSFRAYILITIIATTPYQLIYFSISKHASLIDKYSANLGISGYESILAKISICSLIALLASFIFRFIINALRVRINKK